MANYNRCVFIGNLTRDPEIRYTDGGGKAVTKFSLAVNRKSKGGDEVLFIDVVAWEKLADICNQYLKKGQPALVEGRLAIRDYDKKDGTKGRAVEIVASEVQFLGGREGTGGGTRSAAPQPASANKDECDGEIPF